MISDSFLWSFTSATSLCLAGLLVAIGPRDSDSLWAFACFMSTVMLPAMYFFFNAIRSIIREELERKDAK